MRLPVPVYGQRDPQWAGILLGYNTDRKYTIGGYGCLDTCLAMLYGKNPAEVNQILKDNKAFVEGGGDFIWGKSPVLGLVQKYISPRWNGPATDQGVATSKTYLDQGFPLVCEVDFNPATTGEEQHFVVITGYEGDQFLINDPWTNDATTLDKYGGFKRAAVQYRVYDKKFSPDTSLPSLDVAARADAFIAVCTKLNVQAGKDVALAAIDNLQRTNQTYEDQIISQEKQITDAKGRIEELTAQVLSLTTEYQGKLDKMTQDTRDLAQQVNDKDRELGDVKLEFQRQITDLNDKLKEATAGIQQPKETGWKLIIKGIVQLFQRG